MRLGCISSRGLGLADQGPGIYLYSLQFPNRALPSSSCDIWGLPPAWCIFGSQVGYHLSAHAHARI